VTAAAQLTRDDPKSHGNAIDFRRKRFSNDGNFHASGGTPFFNPVLFRSSGFLVTFWKIHLAGRAREPRPIVPDHDPLRLPLTPDSVYPNPVVKRIAAPAASAILPLFTDSAGNGLNHVAR